MLQGAYIVGIGETEHAERRDDVNATEIAWEVISEALGDAGVALDEIDNAVTASQDFWEGRTISSMAVNEVAGGTMQPESKVAADGALAVMYAWARIMTGDHALGLIVAHCKESQVDAHTVELAAFDPYVQRPLGPDETVAAGLQLALLGYDVDTRARIVSAARRRSSTLHDLSPAEVASSPETAAPLRELERAPRMDGACALVICDEPTARRLGRPAGRVVGAATSTDPYWTDRDLSSAPALGRAYSDALRLAGWDGPPEAIELSAAFAHQVLLWGGELGIGEGEELVRRIEDDGLSPWGGWLGGRPNVVAGLSAVAACTRWVRGSNKRAVAHGTTGLLGQSHHIVCVEGAEL